MAHHAGLRILIVASSPADGEILRGWCSSAGHSPTVVSDGAIAVADVTDSGADLVLLDTGLPHVDAFEAARSVRRALGARWIPIILTSNHDHSDDIVRGLESGADDFLVKPLNREVFQVKLEVLGRALHAQRMAEAFRDAKEREAELAANIVANIVKPFTAGDPRVAHRSRGAGAFSGDLVLCARSPAGTSYVLVADAIGHGLSATICVLPLVRIFQTMTMKELSIGDIAAEMNLHLHTMLPTGYYVAAALVAVAPGNGWFEVWNGGLPAGIIVAEGQACEYLPSLHLPLGIIDAATFDTKRERRPLIPGAHVVLHSDGLTEGENGTGEAYGRERMIASLGAADIGQALDDILDAFDAFVGGGDAADDITVAVIALD